MKEYIKNNIQKITSDKIPILKKYYEGISPERNIIQYDGSFLWMFDEKYYYVEYKETLLIIKNAKIMGKNVWNLVTPPISLNNDKALEMSVLTTAVEECYLNCRFTEQEVLYYEEFIGDRKMITVDGYKGDYVYLNKSMLDTTGKSKSKSRRRSAKLAEMKELTIEYIIPSTFNEGIKNECLILLDEWVSKKIDDNNDKSGYKFHLKTYINKFEISQNSMLMLVRYDGKLVGYNISERLNDRNICLTDTKAVYPEVMTKWTPTKYITYLELKYWDDLINTIPMTNEIYYNIGNGGGNKALETAKQNLHPAMIMKIYKMDTKDIIIENEFKVFLDNLEKVVSNKTKKGIDEW